MSVETHDSSQAILGNSVADMIRRKKKKQEALIEMNGDVPDGFEGVVITTPDFIR
jgi:hypothetical protein